MSLAESPPLVAARHRAAFDEPAPPPLPLPSPCAVPDGFEPEPPPRRSELSKAELIARLGMPPPVVRVRVEPAVPKSLWRKIRAAPAFFVSLILHLLAVLALAAYTLPILHKQFVLEIYAETLGEQISEDTLQTPDSLELMVESPGLAFDGAALDLPLAAPAVSDLGLDSGESAGTVRVPEIGLALTGREPGKQSALLAAYGGTSATQTSVRLGLDWLQLRQHQDGGWSLKGKFKNAGQQEDRVAATAMALLAFQGAGSTHQNGEYTQCVKRGWAYLLQQQRDDGYFDFQNSPSHYKLYAHAQATIALCEIYGMTKDENIRGPAQKSLDYCHRIQSPEGGWRYTPYKESDTSVTGWFVMALQSGRMAGLEVQSPTQDNVSKFLDSVASDGGAQYGYQGPSPSTPLTAEALLCRQYLGWKHDDERLQRGVAHLLENPIDLRKKNVYYWYYATQVCHHMDGPQWQEWNRVLRQKIPESQETTGPEAGSWSPVTDRWGQQAGRLYQTCLSIYLLEVYYRHLPIYKYRLD